jgi:cysteinyl-tRNA synthetase
MVSKHLPEGADIHGGGTDIRFPHHENELAQSVAAHPDQPFVRAWAHHGMVTLASGKMAKSVGNVLDVGRAVNLHGRNAVRMWLLQSHYSQPIEYSEEILEEKRRAYERLMRLYLQISGSQSSSGLSETLAARLRESFDAAMQDDLNTPAALATLFEVAGRAGREISTRSEASPAGEFASLAEAIEDVMTIFGFDLAQELSTGVEGVHIRYSEEPGAEVLYLVATRERARLEKDWLAADRLRDELQADGWAVEDTSEGPILSRR